MPREKAGCGYFLGQSLDDPVMLIRKERGIDITGRDIVIQFDVVPEPDLFPIVFKQHP